MLISISNTFVIAQLRIWFGADGPRTRLSAIRVCFKRSKTQNKLEVPFEFLCFKQALNYLPWMWRAAWNENVDR